jgi:hypothetical protein
VRGGGKSEKVCRGSCKVYYINLSNSLHILFTVYIILNMHYGHTFERLTVSINNKIFKSKWIF